MFFILFFIMTSGANAYYGKYPTDDKEETDVVSDFVNTTNFLFEDIVTLFESQKEYFEIEQPKKTLNEPFSYVQYNAKERAEIIDKFLFLIEVAANKVPMIMITWEDMLTDFKIQLFYGEDSKMERKID